MDKRVEKAWEYFCKKANELGYSGVSHNGDACLGTGSNTFKADRFVPIISLHIWEYPKPSMSIHVEDRNGNSILDGPTCAIHVLDDCEGFNEKFERMCNYVFDKYSKYSKQNRLDFVFNELMAERMEWNVR